MTDFEALYKQHSDPWALGTAWYERRKRSLLLACLPCERYQCALELGCGTGDTTMLLAARCQTVQSVDLSETAIARCRQRLTDDGISNVHAQIMRIPAAWPDMPIKQADLIVVSELAYYLDDPDLDELLIQCLQSLAPGGDWLMCHYTDEFHDRCQNTDKMHAMVDGHPGLKRLVSHGDEHFRLDIWRKHERGDA
ncbi:MAG: class I SAM-dependent methyltransferase [Pusillimonas sp.]